MTKPNDIPLDVWLSAHQLHFDEIVRTAGKPELPHLIARAIMAERSQRNRPPYSPEGSKTYGAIPNNSGHVVE